MEERFNDWKAPKVKEGELTRWHWKVIGLEGFQLGLKTDIGAFTFINARSGVVIEDEVQIGAHCAIYSESTIDNKKAKVVLKKNCKIGANSVVLPGVTVGENSVVGAMSLISKDIPANSLAFGIPAKVQRQL